MVKPVVMGIIGGMIGAIAIIGGLFAFLAYQDTEYQRFNEDYLTAFSYQSEIDEFLIYVCRELEIGFDPDQFDSLEQRLQSVALFQQESLRIDSLRLEIDNIQQKYYGTQYYDKFNFQEYDCLLGDYELVTKTFAGNEYLVLDWGRTRQLDDFVKLYDREKGGDYYIDRYYNEPAYQKFFDFSFSKLTIEEAVNFACSTCNYDLRGRD